VYDGQIGGSFLSHEGAKDVGVEFYSLSKSFNITGSRVSFVLGNAEIIKHFKMLRSQIDYGIFLPIQYAAIAALTGPQDSVKNHCKEYEERRNALCRGLTSIGWNVPDSKGTMFVWAKIPSKYTNSYEFCMDLMEKTGVICTPGSAFGTLGEGYVRFALVLPVCEINDAVNRIKESGIL
jgi:LL-diaminopimelate aminotransferase